MENNKGLPEGIVMLHMDDKDFFEQLFAAIGADPGERVEFVTPQFERDDGVKVMPAPTSTEGWNNLKALPDHILVTVGLGKWDETDEGVIWLFPKEWYDKIPEGFLCTDIDACVGPFEKGVTDSDYRYGCLAYGILKLHSAKLLVNEAKTEDKES